MKIHILKYGSGSGNTTSLINSLRSCKQNLKITLSDSIDDIKKSEIIILPGVGSFDYAMSNIKKLEIDKKIKEIVKRKEKKILGICLGMQILFESSEEGKVEGLCILSGKVKRIYPNIKYRTNFGWNKIISQNNKYISDKYFYFAHSYYVDTKANLNTAHSIINNFEILSFIKKNNIYGVQFHPEKSSHTGLEFISNFLNNKL